MTKDFRKHVISLSEKSDTFMLPCQDIEDASLVICEILKHAKTEVFIYENCLDNEVIGNKYNLLFNVELLNFFKNGGILNIAFKDEEYKNSIIYDTCEMYLSQFKDQINIQVANNEFIKNLLCILKYDVSFMVSDQESNAFILNLPERSTDKNKADAISSFNNINISNRLRSVFGS